MPRAFRSPSDASTCAADHADLRTSVFIIDPKKTIRLILQYPASTGRQFNEILRCIDSLQTGDKNRVTTVRLRLVAEASDSLSPPTGSRAERVRTLSRRTCLKRAVIVHPSVSNDEADKLFPKGVEHVKPYLRFTQL